MVTANIVQAIEVNLFRHGVNRTAEVILIPIGHVTAAKALRINLITARNEHDRKILFLRQFQSALQQHGAHRANAQQCDKAILRTHFMETGYHLSDIQLFIHLIFLLHTGT